MYGVCGECQNQNQTLSSLYVDFFSDGLGHFSLRPSKLYGLYGEDSFSCTTDYRFRPCLTLLAECDGLVEVSGDLDTSIVVGVWAGDFP